MRSRITSSSCSSFGMLSRKKPVPSASRISSQNGTHFCRKSESLKAWTLRMSLASTDSRRNFIAGNTPAMTAALHIWIMRAVRSSFADIPYCRFSDLSISTPGKSNWRLRSSAASVGNSRYLTRVHSQARTKSLNCQSMESPLTARTRGRLSNT